MTITVSLSWVLLLVAVVLAILPSFRRQRHDYDFGFVIWIAVCYPPSLIFLVWAVVEFARG